MSLYRKYRPQVFAQVVGQDPIVTTLEHAIAQGKVAHAYLFSGSRGTGKTSVARILAKHLLTQKTSDDTLRDAILKGVEEGNLVDLLEIDAASHTQVDNIRELIEKIQFSPVVACAKVYIIDEVHMLSKSAFNALLKTLEEPPPYAYFILATTELHKIPDTIQSRCQRFVFHRIREEDIIRHLQSIADQEHIEIDRTALRVIAHHVQGGLRDALSILDQLRSLEKITPQEVQERIGTTGEEYVETLLSALNAGDEEKILNLVQSMENAAIPLDNFLRQFLRHLRQDLHTRVAEHREQEPTLSMLDTLLTTIGDLRSSPIPGLTLESSLLSLCTKMQKKEVKTGWFGRKKDTSSPTIQKEVPTESPPSPPSNEATVEAPEFSLENLQRLWPEILREVTPAAVKMSLKNGLLRKLEEKTLTVSFYSTFHRDKVTAIEASRTVERVMERLFKRPLRLECVLEEERATPPPTTEPVNIAEAAAEVFGN